MAPMVTRGIRDYMSRDWNLARQRKDAYWGERIARLGPIEAFRVADELRRQARLMDPAWPGAAERREDYEGHLSLVERFGRADSAFHR
jgi:hypothetical protein